MPDVLENYVWPVTLDDRAKAIFEQIKDGRIYLFTHEEVLQVRGGSAAMVHGRLKRIKDVAYVAGYDCRFTHSRSEDTVVIQVKKAGEDWL